MPVEEFVNRGILFAAAMMLTACIGPNPNPREGEIAMLRYEDPQEMSMLEEAAKFDESWAQLRLGVAYELGVDVDKDIPAAIAWYKKAAAHVEERVGAQGILVESLDKNDFNDYKGDALIALHQLANIYLDGNDVEKNLTLAYLLENYVKKESYGKRLFYCCRDSGGRYISSHAIVETILRIEAEMTPQQLKEVKAREAGWSIWEVIDRPA